MTLAEAIERAPAIGADSPEPSVSSVYQYVDTRRVLCPLIERGWTIMRVRQNKRDDRYAMHSVTLGVPDVPRDIGVATPTATIYNSHDRTRRLTLQVGLFVLICGNGLCVEVAGLSQTVSKIHLQGGDFEGSIAALCDSTIESHASIAQDYNAFRATELSDSQRVRYAQDALAARRGLPNGQWVPARDAEQLLMPLHEGQRNKHDLWTTFNVVQERVVERGARGHGIQEVRRNAALNNTLWQNARALAYN